MTPPHSWRLVCAATAAGFLGSCVVHPNQVVQPHARIGGIAFSDFEADISAGELREKVGTDVLNLEVGAGFTYSYPVERDALRKLARIEMLVGYTDYDVDDATFDVDTEAIELAIGGRFYFGGPTFQPFLAFHGVGSFFDDAGGTSVGEQFGWRGGGGIEVAITDRFFVDLTLDYTEDMFGADTDFQVDELRSVELGFSGWALRFGAGLLL
ncbi:MAG: hypothetical protein AAGA20_14600 [Planctomycetota bacterium]